MKSLAEEKLPSKLNFSIWKKVFSYALREWPYLLVVFLAMLVTTFYDSAFVPTMNAAAYSLVGDYATLTSASEIWDLSFDVIWIRGAFETSMNFGLFLGLEIGFIFLRSVSIFLTFYFANMVSMRIIVSMRRDSFRHVQELSFSYFDHTKSGWLIARMNNDTSALGDVLSWNVIQIVWSALDLLFTFITMFSQDWRYALIVTASIPLLILLFPILQRISLKRWRSARNSYSHFVGWLSESINGSKTIKTLGNEESISKEAKGITDEIASKRWKAARVNILFNPIIEILRSVLIAVIVLIGVYEIRNASNAESASLAQETAILSAKIVLFVGFVGSIYDPLRSLSEIWNDFIANQAGAEKVVQLLEAKVDIVDSKEVIEKYGTELNPKNEDDPKIEGNIDFENVTFDYGNGVEVIHPLSLHIKKGTSLAIVGETGSGKTTLVNLLCRFYEPTTGVIKIDGTNYKERSLGWLHHQIGYVQQTPLLLEGSYFDNIAYGKKNVTLEEVKKVAKLVGIDSFIEKEKDGYNTFLSDGGETLSAGQRQLISFARALLRDPEILILDEATSAIDVETETLLQEKLLPLLKGRTSITIAHRLSTIVESDRILLMDHGVILEDGTHKELMERKGAYYRLYQSQFQELSMEKQLEVFTNQIEKKDIKI